jgi:uncharacterized protein YeaO (DUF488 family)
MIRLKRAYEPASRSDGTRILVERLWPRGVSKAQARIDLWARDVAPSTELRRWFQHDPAKWVEFKKRYFEELRGHDLGPVLELVRRGTVTFVYGSREERFNAAMALREYVARRAKTRR